MKKKKQKINVLLEKHWPREEIQEKEMVSTQWKRKRESALKLKWHQVQWNLLRNDPVEHEEEASRRKYEVIGTDIEMEYEDMDTEDEEH